MNNNFLNDSSFPGKPLWTGDVATPNQETVGEVLPPLEQSFIENILRVNRGKKVDIYMSFTDSTEWRNRIFSGIVEQSGRDHIIISDPRTGKWFLLLMIYVNYVEFHEPINYNI